MSRLKRLAVPALLAGLLLGAPAAAAGVTISPLPGTPTAMPKTQISFLRASARALGGVSAVGSTSGRHRGRLGSYASATGTSFLPSKPFTPGERVSVHAKWHVSEGKTRALSSTFPIAKPR